MKKQEAITSWLLLLKTGGKKRNQPQTNKKSPQQKQGGLNYLEVIIREQQHLTQRIIQNLCFPLNNDIFIVYRFNKFWLCLQERRKNQNKFRYIEGKLQLLTYSRSYSLKDWQDYIACTSKTYSIQNADFVMLHHMGKCK